MDNKKLKRIMTNLAAGHISQKEADILIKPKKVAIRKPQGKPDTHKRKNQLNQRSKK